MAATRVSSVRESLTLYEPQMDPSAAINLFVETDVELAGCEGVKAVQRTGSGSLSAWFDCRILLEGRKAEL